MAVVSRKNYSFYMATDFIEKLEKVQANNPSLKALSRSQALYVLVSDLADNIEKGETGASEEESQDTNF